MKLFSFLFCFTLCISCKQNNNETLTVCFTGDLLLDRGVRLRIERYGLDTLFSNVSVLFHKSDAVVANLECPVTNRKTPINKHYIFRGEPQWLNSLKKAGITHLAMANNHSNDQGRDGMEDTYHSLVLNKLVPVGFGKNHTLACQPVIIKKGNIQLAVFNSVQLILENFPFLPDRPCVCQANAEELASAITTFKKDHANAFVVVILHWGEEYETKPMPTQIADATKIIQAGADAIIGHHPHVIQTIGRIDGKPVFYSLGNFIFDSNRPNTSVGLIVQLIFNSRKTTVIEHEIKIKNCKPDIIKSAALN